MKIVDYRD